MMFPKAQKPIRDPAYLARVRELPCVICRRWPTEAHHCIHGRYSQRKASDHDAIPLCPDCHAGLHLNKKAWALTYGYDTTFIARTRALLEEKE